MGSTNLIIMKLLPITLLASKVFAAVVFNHEADFEQQMQLYKPDWTSFKNLNSKFYTGDEEIKRFKIWLTNKKQVDEHNELFNQGLEKFEMKVSYLSDWTKEELKKLSGRVPSENVDSDDFFEPLGESVPESKDWRDYGLVSSVKSQGQCGSCWAFSAAGAMEGAWKKAGHSLQDLSEQHLVDCTKGGYYGNYGCDGGNESVAFKYTHEIGGLDGESSYPYEGIDYKGCRHKNNGVVTKVSSYKRVKSGDENALLEALATYGPISIAMDVTDKFYNYKSGLYYDNSCSKTYVNHAMLLVGYGVTSSGAKYWIVKNSWGTNWGYKGYLYVYRGYNVCGIAYDASFPVV